MIDVQNITKRFDGFTALKNLSLQINKGCIYGLVGANGAGKSTLLRLLCGVYKPEQGTILIDDMPVYNNPIAKAKIAFIADDPFFLPQSNIRRMASLYAATQPKFSQETLQQMLDMFSLSDKKPLSTFSKGMRRQAAVALALACRSDFLFMDETFDGLDPVMRAAVKRVIYEQVEQRGATAILASHSLRELEDTCDQLALLHKGGVVFESDVENLKTSLFKVQIAFQKPYDKTLLDSVNDVQILSFQKQGSVSTAILRGDRDKAEAQLRALAPILLEILPLSLEEVFLNEMDALGYIVGKEA